MAKTAYDSSPGGSWLNEATYSIRTSSDDMRLKECLSRRALVAGSENNPAEIRIEAPFWTRIWQHILLLVGLNRQAKSNPEGATIIIADDGTALIALPEAPPDSDDEADDFEDDFDACLEQILFSEESFGESNDPDDVIFFEGGWGQDDDDPKTRVIDMVALRAQLNAASTPSQRSQEAS